MRVAYEGLPADEQRFLEGKVAVHGFAYSRGLVDDGLFEDDPRPGAAHAPGARAGQPGERPEGILRGLARLRDRRHAHGRGAGAPARAARGRDAARAGLHASLAVGDLVMWDNRCTLHRGRPWDESRYRRVMHRTTVAGEGPTAPDDA